MVMLLFLNIGPITCVWFYHFYSCFHQTPKVAFGYNGVHLHCNTHYPSSTQIKVKNHRKSTSLGMLHPSAHRYPPPDTVHSFHGVWKTHGAVNKHVLIYGRVCVSALWCIPLSPHTLTKPGHCNNNAASPSEWF